MLFAIKKFSIGLFLSCSLTCVAQHPFVAGFKTFHTYDSSRGYKPDATDNDPLRFRPIHIDVWYPACKTSADTTLKFFDLVKLLEQRANLYDDSRNYDGFSEELMQYIGAFSNSSNDNLKNTKTESYINAKRINGTFPLIIYFCAMNGMSYENYFLFENLAKNGFLVATVSSIGRYPGNMTMDFDDLVEQVYDAKFIKKELVNLGFQFDREALIGYSWGGLAASLFTMMNPSNVDALVSLNGSERFHYYGNEDDKKLDLINGAEIFDPSAVESPYLYLDSDPDLIEDSPDSIYHFAEFLTRDETYLKVTGSTHEDFSAIGFLVQGIDKGKYEVVQDLTISYLTDKLKHMNNFPLSVSKHNVSSQIIKTKKDILKEENIVITGMVMDKNTKLSLPYVNVGVLHKDIGTATDANGGFKLTFSEANRYDTVKLSMIGYQPTLIIVNDLLKISKERITLYLTETHRQLKEITIEEKSLKSRVLGNKTTSTFFGGKFASENLGSEMAIKINIGNRLAYLGKFQFNISYNTADTATFRLNLYSIKDGMPHENILKENIIVRIDNKTGKIEIDLSQYNIVVDDDFFASLEFIEGSKNSGIVFSAGFVNKGTFYRKASQSRWKKFPMGVGFNVTAIDLREKHRQR